MMFFDSGKINNGNKCLLIGGGGLIFTGDFTTKSIILNLHE